jgi:hypothetical protein
MCKKLVQSYAKTHLFEKFIIKDWVVYSGAKNHELPNEEEKRNICSWASSKGIDGEIGLNEWNYVLGLSRNRTCRNKTALNSYFKAVLFLPKNCPISPSLK